MEEPLLFLIKLAWACRYRLPILITVGFMALDIRMQLEIHVQMRRVHREPPLPLRGGRWFPGNATHRNGNNADDSDASWSTIDEEEQDFNYSRDEELSNDASTSQLAIETTSTD